MRIKVRKYFREYKRYNPGLDDYIVQRLDELEYDPQYKDHKIIVAYDGDTVLGWALLYLKKRRKTYEFMVYTRPKYQGCGVGRKLLNKATKLVDYITVYPHDKKSARFFKAVLKDCPIKYRVEFFSISAANEWRHG